MSPIDDELRSLLHARADVLAPAADPLGGIERRARRMRRNRVAASVAGAALAVSAIAVAVPLLRPGTDSGATQLATHGPSAQPSPPSTSTAVAGALDPLHPWPYRGDPALIAGSELVTLRAEWATGNPGTTLTPLFGQVYEPSGQTEIAFVAAGTSDRWGVARSSEAGWEFSIRSLPPGPVTALMMPLPGDEVPRLLILAAPSTGDISYAADGTSYKSVAMVRPGVAFQPLEGDTSSDRVRVLDGNGDLDHPVFEGSAPEFPPNPSPSPNASPTEVTSAPVLAARYAFDPARPWAYRGAQQDGTGDITSADRKQFVTDHGETASRQETPLYVAHLSATTDVAVVLHRGSDGDWVSFTAHSGTATHQVAYEPSSGEDILSAYVPLDAQHGLLIAVVSDQAGNAVLQTGDRAEVGGSRTAGIWDWTPTADPQARLAAFAKGDIEPYASQPAN